MTESVKITINELVTVSQGGRAFMYKIYNYY